MGRFLGKCKGEEKEKQVGEITAATTVGVRTRARAALAMAANNNKTRKASTTTSFNVHHHDPKKRRKTTDEKENSKLINCSCCSSINATTSNDVVLDRSELLIADPQEVEGAETSPRCFNHNRTARSQKTPGITKSNGQDSPDAKSTVQVKMPSDSEIEDFFTAAQKDIHKRFTDKYNFDIVKDVPLEGRYEWVQIKP